ncbi:MAG TPA: hypothetical protein VHC44_14300, partial [Verrucomicrobiae bacterium]|nr:hypothetical protein [Verrucomicrobiae bacterium]
RRIEHMNPSPGCHHGTRAHTKNSMEKIFVPMVIELLEQVQIELNQHGKSKRVTLEDAERRARIVGRLEWVIHVIKTKQPS